MLRKTQNVKGITHPLVYDMTKENILIQKTDSNSSLPHVLVQQKDVVMILSILDTNMYDYCV